MCVRMGFTCLRDIAQATRIPFDPDPEPDDPDRPARAASSTTPTTGCWPVGFTR